MELTERLIFYPKTKVEFLRTKGIEMGTITNEIVEDSTGGITSVLPARSSGPT